MEAIPMLSTRLSTIFITWQGSHSPLTDAHTYFLVGNDDKNNSSLEQCWQRFHSNWLASFRSNQVIDSINILIDEFADFGGLYVMHFMFAGFITILTCI